MERDGDSLDFIEMLASSLEKNRQETEGGATATGSQDATESPGGEDSNGSQAVGEGEEEEEGDSGEGNMTVKFLIRHQKGLRFDSRVWL